MVSHSCVLQGVLSRRFASIAYWFCFEGSNSQLYSSFTQRLALMRRRCACCVGVLPAARRALSAYHFVGSTLAGIGLKGSEENHGISGVPFGSYSTQLASNRESSFGLEPRRHVGGIFRSRDFALLRPKGWLSLRTHQFLRSFRGHLWLQQCSFCLRIGDSAAGTNGGGG